MKYLAVQQDFAHHIQSEPVMQVADVVLFPWPIAMPEGFDRVGTPLIDAAKVEAYRVIWEAACPEVPAPNPQPIPDPTPELEELLPEEEPEPEQES